MANRPLMKKPYLVKRGAARPGAAPVRPAAAAPGWKAGVPARSVPRAQESGSFVPARQVERVARENNESFVVQIGLDFGTCYSKCVCRDLGSDRAWVHLPEGSEREQLPFLIPCVLQVRDGKFAYNPDRGVHYPDQGLYHLKLAVVAVGSGCWDAPVLDVYRRRANTGIQSELASFVEAAATYFLATVLADVRRGVSRHFSDFGEHPSDLMLVNMAIPVADISRPEISAIFLRILRRAWSLSTRITQLDQATAANQRAMLVREMPPSPEVDHCYLYPEVSASVQGFVRSRSAREATYLCADVGAGTVDMSLFVFHRPDDGDCLTYLDARVLPLGSSQIELRAAAARALADAGELERMRSLKEKGDHDLSMDSVLTSIGAEIRGATRQMFMKATQKGQLTEALAKTITIRIGGGYADYPYGYGIEEGYDSHFKQTVRNRPATPIAVGIALPRDLDLVGGPPSWMKRLYVAYGLSFFRENLTRHTFPSDLPDLPLAERRILYGIDKEAITKDMC